MRPDTTAGNRNINLIVRVMRWSATTCIRANAAKIRQVRVSTSKSRIEKVVRPAGLVPRCGERVARAARCLRTARQPMREAHWRARQDSNLRPPA